MAEALLKPPRPSSPARQGFPESPAYKWWVTWTIMIGAFLFALDTTIVNIAIPKIMTSLSPERPPPAPPRPPRPGDDGHLGGDPPGGPESGQRRGVEFGLHPLAVWSGRAVPGPLSGGGDLRALAWHEVEPTQRALEGLLQRGGDTGGLLQTEIQATLSRYLTQESLAIAFQDCFLVVALIFVAAAIVSLCIPGGKAKAS